MLARIISFCSQDVIKSEGPPTQSLTALCRQMLQWPLHWRWQESSVTLCHVTSFFSPERYKL